MAIFNTAPTVSSMSNFDTLLDVTLEHLQKLKEKGVRYLPLDKSVLAEIRNGPPLAQKNEPRLFKEVAVTVREPISTPALVQEPPVDSPAARSKAALLDQVRERAMSCIKCPHLASSRKNVVFGVGNPDSPLMFVGEAPGVDEDLAGEPFVGKAGQLLTRVIEAMGLKRQEVYIANVLKCRPDTPGKTSGNRKPEPEEMKTCLPYLLSQIEIIQPKVIVALGATAMEGLFGKTCMITKVRGRWQAFRNTQIMPTYHPSYVLRVGTNAVKREVWEDILQVMDALEMPISEKQRNHFKAANAA